MSYIDGSAVQLDSGAVFVCNGSGAVVIFLAKRELQKMRVCPREC
jgi:hypothetical protein